MRDMPKITSRQPAWLSRSSPAHQLFETNYNNNHEDVQEKLNGPSQRIIAYRGSEVFVANGKTIRWADLASMKAHWESKQKQFQQNNDDDEEDDLAGTRFRTLELRYLSEPIVQLCVSPSKSFLAAVTAHTVHVIVLPDSKLLSDKDSTSIRPRTQMIGAPRSHVLSSANIVSVLWHPFGVAGNSLVTVTSDAVVRVWELNIHNRSTFEEPTLAIDMRKLQDARCAKDDVRPSQIGTSEGFSLRNIGMQVASACFGGTGAEDEQVWSGMTLWVAMTEGDVYALCPLLPARWQASSAVLSSLTSTILAERDDENDTEVLNFQAQCQWLSQQESNPPKEAARLHDFEAPSWIYTTDKGINSVPKLQGPFMILPGDLDGVLPLADIHVIAPIIELDDEQQDISDGLDGMPVSTVCLLTQAGTVYVCADLGGVHGQWLPAELKNDANEPDSSPELMLVGALSTRKQSAKKVGVATTWPSFTPDVRSRHGFYVTEASGVWYFSTEQWNESVENEMSAGTSAGAGLRLGAATQTSRIQRELILSAEKEQEHEVSAPLVINDSDLGHMVLTILEGSPHAAILEASSGPPVAGISAAVVIKEEPLEDPEVDLSFEIPQRSHYRPNKIFSEDLTTLKERLRRPPGIAKISQSAITEQIKLSPAILDLMGENHRTISQETRRMGSAISDLFTRCDMMKAELQIQIGRVRDMASRVDNLAGKYDDDDAAPTGHSLLSRLQTSQDRHKAMTKRFETLMKKTTAVGRPLSDREKTWIGEVDRMARELPENVESEAISGKANGHEREASRVSQAGRYMRRFVEAEALSKSLREQAKAVSHDPEHAEEDALVRSSSPAPSVSSFSASRSLRVPPDIRKQKMAAIDDLLERESALVTAVSERLERLGVVE